MPSLLKDQDTIYMIHNSNLWIIPSGENHQYNLSTIILILP